MAAHGVRARLNNVAIAAVAVVGIGCGRERAAHVDDAKVEIELECADESRSIAAGDLALDDALCGEAWTAWQIETARTVELVHAEAGRTLWLRRRGAQAVVEVRAGDRVASSFPGVTRIRFHEAAPARAVERITLTRGTTTEQVTMSELAKRYPGSRRRSFPLCQLLERADAAQTLTVVGQDGSVSPPITHPSCERDGLLLHSSNRGGIQLRDRNKQRIVIGVAGIVFGSTDTVGR